MSPFLGVSGLGGAGSLIGVNDDRSLYEFTTFTFTPASQTGKDGPTLTELQTAYSGQPFLSGYFTSSNGIQIWTAPKTGLYEIELRGGSGGGAVTTTGSKAAGPGLGATIIVRHTLTESTQYNLVVGQQGQPNDPAGTGGGGGSWIYTGSIGGSGLIACAGGGGGWYTYNGGSNGMGGSSTTDSNRAAVGTTINGYIQNGTGNTNGIGYGGGQISTGQYAGSASGAGWLSDGSTNSSGQGGDGGAGTRWTGGTGMEGGFGGGGGGNVTYYGAAGGGGYTGGPAGNGYSGAYWGSGGGGGSYWISGELQSATAGANGSGGVNGTANNPEDGYIKITSLS